MQTVSGVSVLLLLLLLPVRVLIGCMMLGNKTGVVSVLTGPSRILTCPG